MTVGFPLTKDQLDTRLGQIALQVRDGLEEAVQIKALLDTISDATLLAAPFSYTQGEIDIMKSAYTDLYNLSRIANNLATQAATNDFLYWAKKLLGVYG